MTFSQTLQVMKVLLNVGDHPNLLPTARQHVIEDAGIPAASWKVTTTRAVCVVTERAQEAPGLQSGDECASLLSKRVCGLA